jgi:malate synthase
MSTLELPAGVEMRAPAVPAATKVLTPEAISLLASLHRTFDGRRRELLRLREERQARLDAGERFDFLSDTTEIRRAEWQCATIPEDLRDRRVEITGPTDRKMIINALNSGAKIFMADFEDANAPTWQNLIEGQANLQDAIRRTIAFDSPEGKHYALNDRVATLLARPRGWHLNEKHFLVDGQEMSGSLFDFGLYFFHNARELLQQGSGPYFYLPKMESHLEARLWNDVFVHAQRALGIPEGTIRATVLIETLPAAFEMDEILYELRDHSAGLNCGRWDYIFSCIKKRRSDPAFVLPDRALVTMTTHFMRSYSLLLIKTCHRRGTFAMGGMAAQIPIKNDPAANEEALARVRADKEREAGDGHDGTWVAHPGLVPVAMAIFDRLMPQPNQIDRRRDDVAVTADDLLQIPVGPITENGLRTNVNVGVRYLAAWIGGNGCVPINNLMEDAATAEISRAQVWQWIHHPKGVLDDGRQVTTELFRQIMGEELAKIAASEGQSASDGGRFDEAARLFDAISTSDRMVEFLTLPGYALLD